MTRRTAANLVGPVEEALVMEDHVAKYPRVSIEWRGNGRRSAHQINKSQTESGVIPGEDLPGNP